MKKHPLLILLLTTFFAGINATNASPLNLSNVPLYLGGSVDPNIMFIIDDSGSMHFELMPEELRTQSLNPNAADRNKINDEGGPTYMFPRGNTGLYGAGDNRRNNVPSFRFNAAETRNINERITAAYYRSSAHNTIYYNPAVTYLPWRNDQNTGPYVTWGGTSGNANPTSAFYHPIRTDRGSINLTIENSRSAFWVVCTSPIPGEDGCSDQTDQTRTFYPAVYYHFNGGEIWDVNNYEQVEIRSTTSNYSGHGRENRSDCVGGNCTYEQEIQNFANWYTYYRSRLLASQAGIGRSFAAQSENMRVGFGTLNSGPTDIDGVDTNRIVRGVRSFSGANRTAFFNQLYTRTYPFSGTPLRQSLFDVGTYFSRADNRGPWGNTPGTDDNSEHLQCRASYTIMMTDGYWSGTLSNSVGNVDGSAGPVISGPNNDNYQYQPVPPFSDSFSNTFADVAMHFWNRDLRPNLPNRVPTSNLDPSFWQNMVTFSIGLGVTGSIDPEDAFQAISTNSAIDWPEPEPAGLSVYNISKIDDLLHAAVNSRGGFFSASDPDDFTKRMGAVLSNISDRSSSASSVALNSGSISSESRVFQARFSSGDWSGQLLAFPISSSDGTLLPLEWDARDFIPAANNRTIITYDGSNGQPFRWSEINSDQQALLLDDPKILDYLRGDQSFELNNGGEFRNRNFLLGDIVNSAPTFVGAPSQRYPDNWGAGAAENNSPYSAFREANKTRMPVVYVGANDGMLHAFNANTGAELFGYVPSTVYNNLKDLTDPNYTHRYYVDGSPTVVDAFVDGSWKTILVSGLGAGGQGVFALDVTNPAAFLTEGPSATSKVLWEFTDEDDRDMGYTYGQPSIIRLQNGDWAALFSGGYNNTFDNNQDGDNSTDSTTGNATLYLVNLADGNLIRKFDTRVGTNEDPTSNNRPNGLASPAAIDVNGDFIADKIYAGDLFGNIWKIDISAKNTNSWGFAFGSNNNPQPLYNACFGNECSGANIQPITTRPQVVRHPTANGFLVLFGTGKYFEVGDNKTTDEVTQSFYAIWDKEAASERPDNRLDLKQREILQEISQNGSDFRVTSGGIGTEIDWQSDLGWYVDLQTPNAATNLGERQVSNAIVRNGRIIFTTLLPSDDPCEFGGSGWLMEFDLNSGARLEYSVFDINEDGTFDSADFLCIENCDLDADGNPDPDRVLVPASGKKSEVGIIPTPSIASEAGGQREYKYTSGSSGEIEVIVENPGPGFEGRQSWRQLEFNFQ